MGRFSLLRQTVPGTRRHDIVDFPSSHSVTIATFV